MFFRADVIQVEFGAIGLGDIKQFASQPDKMIGVSRKGAVWKLALPLGREIAILDVYGVKMSEPIRPQAQAGLYLAGKRADRVGLRQ